MVYEEKKATDHLQKEKSQSDEGKTPRARYSLYELAKERRYEV